MRFRCVILLALASVTLTSAQQSATTIPGGQEGAFRIGPGVSAPTVLHRVEPGYTEEARAVGLEGTVRISIVVDENGIPQNLRVVRGLGSGLDEKAMDAVRQWRFRPGTKDGKPVSVLAVIEVNFRLLNAPPPVPVTSPALDFRAPSDPRKATAIDRLLTLSNIEVLRRQLITPIQAQSIVTVMNPAIQQIPPERRGEFRNEISQLQKDLANAVERDLPYEQIKTAFAQAYDETFTLDEINSIAAFFDTPAGRAYAMKSPLLTAKTNQLLQGRVVEIRPSLLKIAEDWVTEIKKKLSPTK